MATLFDDPKKLGLLAAGLGILANNRGNYGRAGPAIGAGGLLGLQAYQQAQEAMLARQLREEELAKRRRMEQAQREMAETLGGLLAPQQVSPPPPQAPLREPTRALPIAPGIPAPELTQPPVQPIGAAVDAVPPGGRGGGFGPPPSPFQKDWAESLEDFNYAAQRRKMEEEMQRGVDQRTLESYAPKPAPAQRVDNRDAYVRLAQKAMLAGDAKTAEFALKKLDPDEKFKYIDTDDAMVVFDESAQREVMRMPKGISASTRYREEQQALREGGKLTAKMRELEKMTPEQREMLRPFGGGMTFNLGQLEKAEQGEKGKYNIKAYDEISNEARIARGLLGQLDIMQRQLDKADFKTGWGGDARAAGANLLAYLGVKDAAAAASSAQAFRAAAMDIVLQKQLAQKGPQTESDARRLEQTTASLGSTPEANKFLIAAAKATANRDIERQRFYNTWWKQNGTFEGADDAWLEGPGSESIFDRPELKQWSGKAGEGGTVEGYVIHDGRAKRVIRMPDGSQSVEE